MDKKKYKAYIESIEENENTFELILDGIEAKKFDELNADNLQEKLNDIGNNIFVLSLSKESYRKSNIVEESKWISFTTDNTDTEAESYPAYLYKDVIFDDEVERVNISDIKPINLDNSKAKIFSMEIFSQSNREVIEKLISDKLPSHIENVLVYNVGQGNCNAITNYHCKPYVKRSAKLGSIKIKKSYI